MIFDITLVSAMTTTARPRGRAQRLATRSRVFVRPSSRVIVDGSRAAIVRIGF